jgi:hypothetical protein
MSYYTLSCVEQVEKNTHEPSTYVEGIACGDPEKWISAMH